MYCTHCGEKIKKNSCFCSACGAAVVPSEDPDEDTDISEESFSVCPEELSEQTSKAEGDKTSVNDSDNADSDDDSSNDGSSADESLYDNDGNTISKDNTTEDDAALDDENCTENENDTDKNHTDRKTADGLPFDDPIYSATPIYAPMVPTKLTPEIHPPQHHVAEQEITAPLVISIIALTITVILAISSVGFAFTQMNIREEQAAAASHIERPEGANILAGEKPDEKSLDSKKADEKTQNDTKTQNEKTTQTDNNA